MGLQQSLKKKNYYWAHWFRIPTRTQKAVCWLFGLLVQVFTQAREMAEHASRCVWKSNLANNWKRNNTAWKQLWLCPWYNLRTTNCSDIHDKQPLSVWKIRPSQHQIAATASLIKGEAEDCQAWKRKWPFWGRWKKEWMSHGHTVLLKPLVSRALLCQRRWVNRWGRHKSRRISHWVGRFRGQDGWHYLKTLHRPQA